MEFNKYIENARKVNIKVANVKLIEIVKWKIGVYRNEKNNNRRGRKKSISR